MTRQAYVDRGRKLMIFWSPKCGCSAIARWWWTGPLGRTLDETEPLGDARRWMRENGCRVKYSEMRPADFPHYRKIAVSRHPFDRAVSGFIDKFVGRQQHKRILGYDRLTPFAQQFWREVRAVSEADAPRLYDGLSFVEFLDAVNEVVFRCAAGEPNLNHHWNTQVPLALLPRAPFYDSVHDISALGELFASLNNEFGFSLVPGVENATDYGAFDGRCLAEASSLDLARDGRSLSRENFRSPMTDAMVLRAYDIDFVTFGYHAAGSA
jgi:hypothetical protein